MLNPIEINFKLDKTIKRALTTELMIKSHDINVIEFHISFDGLELTADHTVKVLSVYSDTKSQTNVTCDIVDGKAIYRPDTSLISQYDYVLNYVYIYRGDQAIDAHLFTYSADSSEIDKTAIKVKAVYDQSYTELLTEFEARLQDYKNSLPQASDLRAEIDVILNQFGVDSQQVIGDLAEVTATAEIAETSRVQAESERVQAETERKEAETLREENYNQKVDTAIVEADVVSKVDSKVTELTPQITSLTAQLAQKAKQVDLIQTNSNIDSTNLRLDELVIESGDANAEVTDAHVSTVKNKTFTTVRNRFEENEQDTLILKNKTEFPFKNIIGNGDFSGGINSWIAEGLSTNEVVNGVLVNTGGLNAAPRLRQNSIPGYGTGKKIAIKMRARVTNEFCTKIEARLVTSGMTTQTFTFQDTPIKDEWYEKTIICTFASGGTGSTFGLQINHIYESTDIANGKQMEIDYICGFDLTGIFGVGNEPTTDKFNEFLSYFPSNSVFDGVSELSVNMLSKTFFNYIAEKYSTNTSVLFFDSDKDGTVSTEGYTWQDITFVGDYLWAFRHSDVNGVDAGVGVIYIFDRNMNLVNQLSHNFGHTNTVDYNPNNDTLIFGNGSGYKGTDGVIYIIQNVKHWADLPKDTVLDINGTILGSNITTIQVYREFNDKVNVCWGEDNNGLHNICYVLSADGQWISKLVLGKGSNQLGNGQFISGLSAGKYNGTYKQISRHTGDKIEVIQGAQYYNGYLYVAMGHDGLMLVKHKLNSDLTMTREIKQEVAYDENGNLIDFASEGVAIKDGFIYHSVFGGINKLFKYRVF